MKKKDDRSLKKVHIDLPLPFTAHIIMYTYAIIHQNHICCLHEAIYETVNAVRGQYLYIMHTLFRWQIRLGSEDKVGNNFLARTFTLYSYAPSAKLFTNDQSHMLNNHVYFCYVT